MFLSRLHFESPLDTLASTSILEIKVKSRVQLTRSPSSKCWPRFRRCNLSTIWELLITTLLHHQVTVFRQSTQELATAFSAYVRRNKSKSRSPLYWRSSKARMRYIVITLDSRWSNLLKHSPPTWMTNKVVSTSKTSCSITTYSGS